MSVPSARGYNSAPMAKASKGSSESKKTTKSSASSAPKKAAAPEVKAAAKKAPQHAARGVPSGTPLIDTSLAAEAAAKMIASRLAGRAESGGTPVPSSDAQKKESSAFKHLKESLAKPHSNAISNILDKTAPPGQKRPFTPPGGKQPSQGQNQTFGADVNRSGVPRRTAG